MAGISQTLYNLFDAYPGNLWMLMPEGESIPGGERLDMAEVRYPVRPYAPIANRLGRFINNGRVKNQMSWRQKNWNVPVQLPTPNDALILVSTTDATKLQLAWLLLRQGYTVIPYFMDDWLHDNNLKWKGNNIQQVAKDILEAAPAWLMISEPLNRILRERYRLIQKPYLVVHNPAPASVASGQWLVSSGLAELQTAPEPPKLLEEVGLSNCQLPTGNCQLIYAGSVWPMHADALIAVARAIDLLGNKNQGKYGLELYIPEGHWEKYRTKLEGKGVEYKGWLPYVEVQEKLKDASMTVCTASFEKAHAAFSQSSTQTKLTDYMASGRPILFVGPDGSASGEFVEKWDCGYWCKENNSENLADFIKEIFSRPEEMQEKGANGMLLAQTTFSKKNQQERLYRFVEEIGRMEQAKNS